MDDLTMWSLVVGTLAPVVIAAIQQPRWSDGVRAVVTALFAVVLGLGTAWFNGDLDGRSITSAILVVLVASITTYKGFWKPTGVAPAVEASTSPHSHAGA